MYGPKELLEDYSEVFKAKFRASSIKLIEYKYGVARIAESVLGGQEPRRPEGTNNLGLLASETRRMVRADRPSGKHETLTAAHGSIHNSPARLTDCIRGSPQPQVDDNWLRFCSEIRPPAPRPAWKRPAGRLKLRRLLAEELWILADPTKLPGGTVL
ncbi:unnamed protein product [Caenorhabditis auriculariae]|uniref:Uncharacterized protein n=1 Tax=Caenorhabditis auriculariae TaxID=2777116 RepID=A0A8S1H726_9PELO|nr:unnamed protein product [Caenorhabditis auriculariae]